jgi:hypothetical protein
LKADIPGKRIRIALGSLLWSSLFLWAIWAICLQAQGTQAPLAGLFHDIGRWLLGATQQYSATADTMLMLAPNDPIFMKNSEGRLVQIGRVRTAFGATIDPIATQSALLLIDEAQLRSMCPHGFSLEYQTTPSSLDWVARTLLSAERRQEITAIITRDWDLQSAAVLSRLQPVLINGLKHITVAVEAELPKVLERHRADFTRLSDRYQGELIQQRIVPLVRKEILPIVEQEIRPVALQLGRELWERVSLWSFTWRYLYDVSPLPERNAVRREFERFLADEITPAIEARTDDFVKVTERIVSRISTHPEVRRVVRESLQAAATDHELQKLMATMLRELFITNSVLQTTLNDYLKSDEVRTALQVASSSFEPSARAIGDAVFGNRNEGITAEFSRVMRTQILLKDRRWLIVVPDTSAPLENTQNLPIRMHAATVPAEFPLVFEGRQQSPLTRPEPLVPLPAINAP